MLFTFPSRYWFTIGLSGVFSLAGWSRRIRSGLHVSRLTQDTAMIHKLACTGLSPSVITFSKVFHFIYFINVAVLLPRYCRNSNGLGLSPVARRYWGNHVCFLLLQVLRCFSSLRLPTLRYNMSSTYWVIPFGDLRIKGYLHLRNHSCRKTLYDFYFCSLLWNIFFHLSSMSKNCVLTDSVENKGVEPLTSCVQSRRSSQLS